MSATKKPRRRYKPRTPVADTLTMALCGAAKVRSTTIKSYMTPLRRLVDTIKLGHEQLTEWSRIRDTAMISEALMQTGAARIPEHERTAIAEGWFEAIESAVARRRRGPRDRLKAQERTQLDSLVMWYEALLSEATQSQLLKAQRTALLRVKQHLAHINREVAAAGLPECRVSPVPADIEELEAMGSGR